MRFSTACTTVGGKSPESFRMLAATVEFANLNVKFLNFVVAGGARRRVTHRVIYRSVYGLRTNGMTGLI